MRTALSIAGSDSCGGAGIQADIKTMLANGVYAMTAVTAITAQNTTGVFDVQEVLPDCLGAELDAVFSDILPDAVKIGMLSSGELIAVVAEKLRQHKAKHIVLDPVMISTSGHALLEETAAKTLAETLLPIAELVTPNVPEAEKLSGIAIVSKDDMQAAAEKIHADYGCGVLLKGGHLTDCADDLLLLDNGSIWLTQPRIDNPNAHGTGCTLSSAIAANLAKGYEMVDAVKRAKTYITGALKAGLNLGKGSGPMNHAFDLQSAFMD